MLVKFGEKEIELKYTFNSFKYMSDFDLTDLGDVITKPFKVIKLSSQLLIGAANNDPKVRVFENEIDAFIEDAINNDTLTDLVNSLIDLLQQSSFFKLLQKR